MQRNLPNNARHPTTPKFGTFTEISTFAIIQYEIPISAAYSSLLRESERERERERETDRERETERDRDRDRQTDVDDF